MKYVVKAAWDETKWVVEEFKGKVPTDRVIGPMIDGEDPAWLQLETIQDPETGSMVPTLTVNQATKDAVLAQRSADEFDRAAEITARKKKHKRLKKKIRQARRDDVTDLESIKDRLDDLTALVKELLTSESDDE